MKKIDRIITLLENINDKLNSNPLKNNWQNSGIYFLISELEAQDDTSNFISNFNITKKLSGKKAIRLNKFIDLMLEKYNEIDFLGFSIVDFEEFHNSRIFNVCNILLKNPAISDWIKENLVKNHKQNDLIKIETEISELDVKYLQVLQNIFHNLKNSGLLKGKFSIIESEGKIKFSIDASYINNFFLTTGWYELAYISKMSNLNNAILINNIKYRKGTSVAELDLMIIKNDDIFIFELKNTKKIQTLYSGLEQLEYHQKIFSVDNSKCFLVVNDDFPMSEDFQIFSDKVKEKGFRLARVSELGNIA